MHLGAPQVVGYLCLRQFVEETKLEDLSLPGWKALDQRTDRLNIEDRVKAGIVAAERFFKRQTAVVGASGSVRGERRVVGTGDGRFDDDLTVDAQIRGDLAGRGRTL